MSLPSRNGDEWYEIPADLELIHTDLKTVRWRFDEFVRIGFSQTEASSMAPFRAAELRDIERWLSEGATHAQVLQIVAPLKLEEEPPKEPLALGAGTLTPVYEGPSPKV